MTCPFNDEQLAQLKAFVDMCKAQPQILHHPKLSFFKDYLTSLGVKIPSPAFSAKPSAPSGDSNFGNNNTQDNAQPFEEESESDVELDMEGVIESDPIDESQQMGDETKEVTDEERDQSDEKRSEAMGAFSEQQFDEAIKLYTEAILLNPQSALLFAKRGQVYLKMNKVNSCIKDCTRALELNCDSAAAFKFRGRAYRLLGKFEEACHDLCESLKIDYDDQTNDWLNEVKPNAEKIRQHKLSVHRKKEENENRGRQNRARKAQESTGSTGTGTGSTGTGTGTGGVDHSADNLKDLLYAFEDPEVHNALLDVFNNPANIAKYKDNPKIFASLEKVISTATKAGVEVPSGGFPGFGGAGAGAGVGAGQGAPKKPPAADDDVGLD